MHDSLARRAACRAPSCGRAWRPVGRPAPGRGGGWTTAIWDRGGPADWGPRTAGSPQRRQRRPSPTARPCCLAARSRPRRRPRAAARRWPARRRRRHLPRAHPAGAMHGSCLDVCAPGLQWEGKSEASAAVFCLPCPWGLCCPSSHSSSWTCSRVASSHTYQWRIYPPDSACACRMLRRNPARRIVEFLPGQPSVDSERGPAPPATDGERAARRRTRSLPRGMMLAAGLGSPVRKNQTKPYPNP